MYTRIIDLFNLPMKSQTHMIHGKSVAYYFTETGNQIREMPAYDIPGNHRGNFDDAPTVDEPCTKNYPGVSFGGYGYVFLWFCPIHGHSYGFNLIAGGEGRKDPFSSLFKYKPTAPDEIFYDNWTVPKYCSNSVYTSSFKRHRTVQYEGISQSVSQLGSVLSRAVGD